MSMTLLLLSTSTVQAIQLIAYGCDTPNVTNYSNFVAAVSISVLHSHTCPYAGPDVDPLGPCFRSPAQVKATLDLQPPGRRAISLEGVTLYEVEDEQHRRLFQDPLSDGGPSPWIDGWASVVQRRFDAWFANFSAIGGNVDIVLSDWELGGHVYWYDFANRDNNGSRTAELLAQDKRWATTRDAMNAAAVRYLGNTTAHRTLFNNVSDLPSWVGFQAAPFTDWRPWIWDIITVDTMVAVQLNRSVYAPIKQYFPSVHFSNFAHHYHSDARESDAWWPWAADSVINVLGRGSHVGTHQSTSFYGGNPFQKYTSVLSSQKMDRLWEATPTPFNAVVQEAKVARDMIQAAPHVPVHPWFAPRDFVVSDPGKLPNASSHLFGSDMWQEALIHVVLTTGATDILWWKPGHMQPYDIGVDLLSRTLNELQEVLNSGSGGATTLEPVLGRSTAIPDWNVPFVLSGARAGPSMSVYRFTPRCLQNTSMVTAACTRGPDSPRNGTRATFHIGSGFSISPIQNGTIWVPPSASVAPLGFWIVVKHPT